MLDNEARFIEYFLVPFTSEQPMSLTPNVARSQIHHRQVDMRIYRREDDLYDVEGHLTDRKADTSTAPFGRTTAAGQPVHEMWIRLTVDADLLIRDASAATDAGPYRDCFGAPPTLSSLVGVRIGAGWTKAVKERLGGTRSCTHLMEMLAPLASAAMQAMWTEPGRPTESFDEQGNPLLLNSCWALSGERSVARVRWPEHYTGAAARADSE